MSSDRPMERPTPKPRSKTITIILSPAQQDGLALVLDGWMENCEESWRVEPEGDERDAYLKQFQILQQIRKQLN